MEVLLEILCTPHRSSPCVPKCSAGGRNVKAQLSRGLSCCAQLKSERSDQSVCSNQISRTTPNSNGRCTRPVPPSSVARSHEFDSYYIRIHYASGKRSKRSPTVREYVLCTVQRSVKRFFMIVRMLLIVRTSNPHLMNFRQLHLALRCSDSDAAGPPGQSDLRWRPQSSCCNRRGSALRFQEIHYILHKAYHLTRNTILLVYLPP